MRTISNSLPGVDRAAGAIGRELAHRPAPYLALVVVVTVLLGIAATGIESTFDRRELLPSDGDARTDLATLDHAFGGSTEDVSVLGRGRGDAVADDPQPARFHRRLQ